MHTFLSVNNYKNQLNLETIISNKKSAYKLHGFKSCPLSQKISIINTLRCTGPQQWCIDWKLEINNPNNSLNFSKPEEAMASLAGCFFGKKSSEKKIDEAADRTKPADLQRMNFFFRQ